MPHPVNVDAGEIAAFECQHPDAEYTHWLINNRSLVPPYPTGITTPERGSILHVLGHPVYNGTRIVCVVFTGLGVLSTPDVTLTVYTGMANKLLYSVHV